MISSLDYFIYGLFDSDRATLFALISFFVGFDQAIFSEIGLDCNGTHNRDVNFMAHLHAETFIETVDGKLGGAVC